MKLNPQDQFTPSQSNVKAVLDCYGLELKSFEAAKSGIENTTLLVSTDGGEFVLRIYRQNKKTDTLIEEEIKFTKFLGHNKLPVPVIIPNLKKEYLTQIKLDALQWQVILMEKMWGDHAKHYSMQLVKSMALVQAKMHLMSEGFIYDKRALPALKELRETVIIKQIEKDGLDERLVAFLDRAQKYTVLLPSTLPSGICHMDYSKGNVLVENGGDVSAVLDFDDMEAAPYAVCLGFALYHLILGEAGSDEWQKYLQQYQTTRKLNQEEINILPAVALFRHYFIGSLQIFNSHRGEEDITKYIAVENDLLNCLA